MVMNPVLHIRKAVLGISQVDFAAIAGVRQGTVSKWEAGQLEPDRAELGRIRQAVIDRGLEWDDSLFFSAPPCGETR